MNGRGRLLATLVSAALVASACSSDDEETASSAAPVNTCPTHPCRAYGGSTGTAECNPAEGFCKVNASLPRGHVFVVSLPDTAVFGPGLTFLMPSDRLPPPNNSRAGCSGVNRCAVLPRLGRSGGAYVVTSAAARSVSRNLGNGAARTSLPAHVTFRALTPEATSLARAFDVGLPVPSQLADAIAELPLEEPPAGPGGSGPIGWDAPLPFGRYERTITPDPPFGETFPPQVDVVTISGRPFQVVELASVDDPTQRRYTLTSDGPSLEGWSASLVDSATRRPISSVARLATGTNEITLNTVGQGDLQEAPIELVLAPPPTLQAVPSMVVPASPTIPSKIVYPRLEPAVITGGVVVSSPDGTPIPARIFVRSSTEPGALASSEPNVILRYETDVRTDALGRYALRLPPGRYDVAVVPEAGTGYGLAISQRIVAIEPPVQQGRSLQVTRQTSLSGSAVVADGRPLAGAEVEARPTVDPPQAFGAMQRIGRTTTDAAGAFSLPLDPGFYDVTVRPAPGSRLPWVFSLGRRVDGADTAPIPPLVVGVPISAGLTLLDPTGSAPMREALVRAYAPVEGRSMLLEIGHATTDADGRFEMFFSPTLSR